MGRGQTNSVAARERRSPATDRLFLPNPGLRTDYELQNEGPKICTFAFMKWLLLLVLSGTSFLAKAQFHESFYALDSNWNRTTADSAKFLIWVHMKPDSNWVYDYYHMWGPLMKSECFKDHDANVKNGTSCYYNRRGQLDSVTHYRDGKVDGRVEKFLPGDSVRLARLYIYTADSLLTRTDFTTTPANAGSTEPEFYGGEDAWQHFEYRNFQVPERAAKAKISGNPGVLFTVDVQGNVSDPVIARSVEYSLDREAMRVISISPRWMPAMHDGIPVTTTKFVKIIPPVPTEQPASVAPAKP